MVNLPRVPDDWCRYPTDRMTNFRIVTLFEITFVVAVCLSLLVYIPPLGLVLPSLYASTRAVARSVRNGNRNPNPLMKTGAIWGIVTMYTIGTLALSVLLANRYSDSGPAMASWLPAILAGFVFGYGGIAAGLGALIGQWTGLYLSWYNTAR